MMTIKIQPLTKKQLAEVVECYHRVFPNWKVIGGERLVRFFGPIGQQIGFERLRSGAYRASTGIWALALPDVYMLHQFLDIRHRDVTLREHPSMWEAVVTAMDQQFRPSIRKPLDLQEVRRLCEESSNSSTNDLCLLAIVSAYLEDRMFALACCKQIERLVGSHPAQSSKSENIHLIFSRQLQEAIEAGKERDFLVAPESDCG